MVAGAAALLVGIQGNASPSQVESARSTHAKPLTSELVGTAASTSTRPWPAGRAHVAVGRVERRAREL